ncbi:hypothetical protein PPERSA_05633 [Pseudocohnilembus persalinus]|uniref:Flavoprotein pyridine nucleotide cytochrome reductase-like FAD-binding domain-containing protein n=1 Tax=Pseudocohnilembus persalinus TaxID=266149 RepID=A0A0V0QQ71_PSEPJ|nr:hypothetical protein PPERSA_05633 [Pseudocohnilembus persalinus]|eukprot:KRX04372.1 hypothetical protein PPERSA_05633 [Pseudocohnilembus persalinus]
MNILQKHFKFLVRIKPQFCIFENEKNPFETKTQTAKSYLSDQKYLNQEYDIVRLQTEELEKCLGLKIGQFIQIQNQNQKAIDCYPISRIDDCGIIDLVVKKQALNNNVMKDSEVQEQETQKDQNKQNQNNNNSSSQEKQQGQSQIKDVKNLQEIQIKGPKTKFVYDGFGNVIYKLGDEVVTKNFDYIGIICENVNITKMFSLIEGISTNGDPTNLSIIQFCRTLDDMVLADEILWLKEQQKINYKVFLENVDINFPSLKGSLDQKFVKDYLPPSDLNALIVTAGQTSFNEKSKTILKELGYNEQNIIQIDE